MKLDGEHPGVGVLGEVAERVEGLFEARHRFAEGPALPQPLPRLAAVWQGLLPHLAPQGMLGQALDMLSQAVAG